jgi:TRAP transporter TAXI family solute receptor
MNVSRRSGGTWIVPAILLLAAVMSPGCAPGDRPDILALATAGTGGVYYVLGGSIAELWSRELPEHDFVAEVTGGSVENLSLLLGGDVHVAFSMGTSAHELYNATGSFSGREPAQVLALTALYPNVLHLVTLEGTGVESLADLVGRRVSVGAPGSGTEVAARTLLEGNGIDYDDFRPQRLNFNETGSALRDGNIDAGFLSAGPPTSAILDLATARRMRLVPIRATEVENTSLLDPTVSIDFFLPGTYPGQDTEVETLSTPNVLVVRADMAEELAYDLIRALFAVRTELASVHPAARHISAEYTLGASPIPLHPGAVRYFVAAGYEVPDHLISSP